MYRIVNSDTGEELGITANPNYIRRKAETGAYVTANVNNAGGVAYKSVAYNLFGREGVGAAQTVILVHLDEGDLIMEMEAVMSMLEDALCEQDTAMEERLALIEDALCEFDREEDAE